ncbi:hypothetical protein A3E46_01480 [Candidatus Woesebacteria bacterium RIFCSPHIGHO2_12_FULL_46_16]|uniref:Uncharacterized protein n=1 Tax=Candidatus Woesebacteria bacterium RIFCSPHIGHO2_12_FULL_46_16 TaxID=1802513 RepID=A0A1F8AWU9_9BACT|nr:MAG: hypothetical protein A3E46_01480 [Candidatus Woesebacteria bacterium RIFCSPHIGHO2_12_FULL_46_16]
MKSELEPICFNCQHWHIDKSALDAKHQDIARKIAEGTNIPVFFGKCRAWYLNPAGEEVIFDQGTLSPTPCQARDFEAQILFKPLVLKG